MPFSQMVVVVKTAGEPRSLISAVTKEVAAMDQDIPLFGVKSMEEYLSSSVAAPRFSTTLLSIFAAVALVLTVVGLYGVMSYSVAQRTNEIGITTGARCAVARRVADDRQAGFDADFVRACDWIGGSVCAHASDREFVVWSDGEGSVHVCGSGGVAGDRRFAGVLHPSVARDESGSNGRAPLRMRSQKAQNEINKSFYVFLVPFCGKEIF